MNKRSVLCHYHIYKNAGTTFERVLDENYGEQHLSFDGPFPFSQINQDQLTNIIDRHPSAMACSSHQIHLPAPSSISFRPIPVVFIRHPMLRIRSVYLFDQRGNRLLRAIRRDDALAGLEEWIKSLLSGRKNTLQINNLQTGMLCRGYNQPPRRENRGGRVVYDIQTAVNNLTLVPCLGRTEHFDHDVASFELILEEYDFPFSYKPRKAENVSAPDHGDPVEKQLQAMKDSISKETWEKLQWLNHQDLELYGITEEIIEDRLNSGLRIPVAKEI